MSHDLKPQPSEDTPLDSWKAIAVYLNRDVRTVMRWEKAERLPVHRHRHLTRSSVYAYRHELDRWRANRSLEVPDSPAPRRPPAFRALASAATLAIATLSAGGGRFDGPVAAMQDGAIDRSANFAGNAWQAPSAALSPDGRYVTYIGSKDAGGDLHVRDLQTGEGRRLTRMHREGGFTDYSAVSHDGRFAAVVGYEQGRVRRGLHLVPLDAGETPPTRLLAEGQWVVPKEWTKDDKQILVVVERDDRRNEIGMVNVADGNYRPLKTFDTIDVGYHVRLSPDGAFIAYDRRAALDNRAHDIFLLPASGGPEIVLLDDPSSDSVVGWSPDGRYLVFIGDELGQDALWALPVDKSGRRAGNAILLADDFRGDALSMTAAGALFYEKEVGPADDRPKTNLVAATVDPASGALIKAPWFAAHDRQALSRFPRWSADGRSFMHVTARAAGKVVSIHDGNTGVVREVPLKLGYVWNFDWSPDMSTIAFRAGNLAADARGVYLVNTDTGAVRPFAISVPDEVNYEYPQFTRDGRNVTYFKTEFAKSVRPGWVSYVERNVDTGIERDVHSDIREFMTGRYNALGRSPDGRYLVTWTSTPTGSTLFAYDTTTRQTREVFRRDLPEAFTYEAGVQWMPDSSAMLVNTRAGKSNERELWWVPIDSRTPHAIDVGTKELVTNAIAVHPDGRQIAFLTGRPVAAKTVMRQTEFRLLERFLPQP